MLDDVSDIAAFYGGDTDREHGRLEEHRLECGLTWRYLQEYLPAEGAVLEGGRRPDSHPRGGFRGYFAHPSEMVPLHEAQGLETLVVAGVEPAVSADDESYNRLPEGQRRLWLDLLYEISAEGSIVGASRHLLYVGRKRE